MSLPQTTQPHTSLDIHRNIEPTGEKMQVLQDEHGHLYPRDDEFELLPGLTPGYTTNGRDFEQAGETIRKVGSILTVPTIETDIHGNPLDMATAGLEGGFEDAHNRAGEKKRKAVKQRNQRIDDGASGAAL
ncbi:MAG: hypothetical protein ACOY82_08870 [Pseudomonadota bacterium]